MRTKFSYDLTDSWWVAFSHGHSAFRLLQIAREIETEYDELQSRAKCLAHGELEYLKTINSRGHLTRQMLQISAASIASFQAMMEGIINNALGSDNNLASVRLSITNKKGEWERATFEDKWKKTLNFLRQSPAEFDEYNVGIYKRFRIPLIHPHNANLSVLDQLEFSVMKSGFSSGWIAYERLYTGLKRPLFPDSWKIMCRVYKIEP